VIQRGDIVHHLRTAQRLYVEGVEGRVIFCAWYTPDGELHRGAYGINWMVPKGTGLA